MNHKSTFLHLRVLLNIILWRKGVCNAELPSPVIFDISCMIGKYVLGEIELPENYTVGAKQNLLLECKSQIPENQNFDSFTFLHLSPIVAYTRVLPINTEWRNLTLQEVLNANLTDKVFLTHIVGFGITYLFGSNEAQSILRTGKTSASPTIQLIGAIIHFTTNDNIEIMKLFFDHVLKYQNFTNNLLTRNTGILYDERTSTVPWIIEFVKMVDVCTLLVETSSKNFVPSHYNFVGRMNAIQRNNEKFVKAVNPNCRIFYNMKWIRNNETDVVSDLRLYLLFLQYSVNWGKESKQALILDTFVAGSSHDDDSRDINEHVEKAMNQFLPSAKDVIIPEIFVRSLYNTSFKYMMTNNYNFCLELLEKTSSDFKYLYFPAEIEIGEATPIKDVNDYECFSYKNSYKKHEWTKHFQNRNEKLKIVSEEFFNKSGFDYITMSIPGSNKDVLIMHHLGFTVSRNVMDQLILFNFSLGYHLRIENIPTYIDKATYNADYLEKATWVIFSINDDFRKSLMYNQVTIEAVMARIKAFRHFQDKFLQVYENKTLIFTWNYMMNFLGAEQNTMFCTSESNNVIAEVIINMARIHDIKIIYKPIITAPYTEIGWYDPLKTRDELRNYSRTCPIFASRGHFVNSMDKRWKPYPCISWEALPTEVIIFGILHGTSFSCEIGKQSSRKSLTLIYQLLFQKFMTVEISGKNEKSCGRSFQNILETNWNKISPENRTLLIEADAMNDDILDLLKHFQRIPVPYRGIHFVGWKNGLPEIEDLGYSVNFGLTVSDCAHEILNGFNAIIQLKFKYPIKYLVCIEKRSPKFSYGMNDLTVYLEDHLFIKSTIQKALQNTKVYFRMEIAIKNLNYQEMLLRFVRDLTKFGNVYGIHYLFQAFEGNDDNLHRIPGWWRVLDYKDLSNSSMFVETESDYFGRPTWTPPDDESDEIPLTKNNFLVITTLIVIGFAVVTIVIASQKYGKIRWRVISKQEEREFQKGTDDNNTMEYLKIKYNAEKFEILLSKIFLGGLIGSGNFGKVHEATIENTKVAVKVTRNKYSSESIKSLLVEVKLLMFLGDHKNVVKFVGSYTKEIGYGVIYIVLGLCENGSLETYLRSMESDNLTNVDIYMFYKFCEEIANGMEFISGKNVVHSDLATRNILLDLNFSCLISDFGLSRQLNEMGEYLKMTEGGLPWRWMSIESLKEKVFTVKTDVWSYGITVWEIFSLGKVPYTREFPRLNSDFILEIENGLRPAKPVLASTEMYDILKRCWDMNPSKRPDFNFFSNYYQNLRSSLYTNLY